MISEVTAIQYLFRSFPSQKLIKPVRQSSAESPCHLLGLPGGEQRMCKQGHGPGLSVPWHWLKQKDVLLRQCHDHGPVLLSSTFQLDLQKTIRNQMKACIIINHRKTCNIILSTAHRYSSKVNKYSIVRKSTVQFLTVPKYQNVVSKRKMMYFDKSEHKKKSNSSSYLFIPASW